MQLKLKDVAQLNQIAGTIHDARFTSDAITFDSADRTFTLKFWALEPILKESSAQRHWLGYRLSFAKITDAKISVKEKLGYYELSKIRFSEREHKLELIAHYAIDISLTFEQLDGTLLKTGETLPERAIPVSS